MFNKTEFKTFKIKDIFELKRGYVLPVSDMSKNKNNENPFPVYSSQTLQKGLVGYYKEYLFEDSITWTTDGANAGDVNYRSGKFYCTNVCGVLLNKKGYSNNYIANLLSTKTKKYVSYVGNPKLMNNVMAEIEIKLPSLQEQQKIGSFLSAIDKLLEIYIKEADSTFKIGRYIINKIFKDEKGFNSSKETKNREWKKVRLADISTLITKGTTPSYYTENGVKFVKVESIENETINFKKINYIDGKTHSSVLNRSQLQENDILFSIAGTLGRKVIVENSMLPANTNQALAIIRVDSNKADFNYINSNLHEEKIKNFIKENVTTGAQPNLSLKQISSLSIELPPLEEQVKISNLDSLFKKLFKFQRERNEFLIKYKKHYLYTIFSTKEQ